MEDDLEEIYAFSPTKTSVHIGSKTLNAMSEDYEDNRKKYMERIPQIGELSKRKEALLKGHKINETISHFSSLNNSLNKLRLTTQSLFSIIEHTNPCKRWHR